ncbi:MAG: ATP synthase subunit I [Anaerolineae bacterium]|nr:ATP synthase subunit I [Anaerolineae bacterium]
MNEVYVYLLPLMAGIGLGLFFFGGLWLTTRQIPDARRPAVLMIVSFLGRTGVSLAGFYLAAAGRWERLLVAIAGFFVVRMILISYGRLEPTKNKDGQRWT